MTTLHDRLDDLAGDAPTPPSAYAGDLWARGKRLQRRRRAGSAVIVAAMVLAVATLGIGSVRQAAQPGYVGSPEAPAALPSRLHEPSPWLPGTDDRGPLGQLAVVLFADRGGWTGSEYAPVGVSATTGEYRYLDLPDRAPANEVALSRDGRRLAYWTTGETNGSPHSSSGPVTGIAVYDTETGEVLRHSVPTAHGLSVDWLRWADGDRVVAGFGQWLGGDGDDENDQSSSMPAPVLVWDVVRDRADDRDFGSWHGGVVDVVGDGFLLATNWGSGHRILRVDDGEPVLGFTLDSELSSAAAASPDHGRVVGVSGGPTPGTIENPNRMVVGELGDGGRVRMRPVPRSGETFAPVAWVDADRVAVTRRVELQRSFDVDLVVVDVVTGESQVLTRGVQRLRLHGSQPIALDLLGVPSVDRPAPPEPWDPRTVAGWSAAVVVAGLVALVLWRRRVRA